MKKFVDFIKNKMLKNTKAATALAAVVIVLLAATLMLLIDCGTTDRNVDSAKPAAYKTTMLIKPDGAEFDTLVDFSIVDEIPDNDELSKMLDPDEELIVTDDEEYANAMEEFVEEELKRIPVITYDYEDVDEAIPFETIYKKDSSMKKGQTRIEPGENGIRTKVYYITFTDGVETSRELVATKEKKKPVAKVVYEGTIDTQTAVRGESFAYTKVIDCKATAYTNDAVWGDHVAFSYLCGGGLRTRWGIIATDVNVIPAGTKVYVKSAREGIKDYGYAIAADIGSAIKGNIIDLWMDSDALCGSFGVKPVEVYVLEDQTVDVFALRGDYKWSR